MNKDKMIAFLENQDELTLIDLMRACLGKEDIIELMKQWDDDKFEDALDNLGYQNKD